MGSLNPLADVFETPDIEVIFHDADYDLRLLDRDFGVSVGGLFDTKIAALRAHRSQIPEDWFMLTVPEESRPELVGRESFVRVFSRGDAPDREDDLFAGLR